VIADGSFGDVELKADLTVGESASGKFGDLTLSAGQGREGGGGRRVPERRKAAAGMTAQLLVLVSFCPPRLMHCSQEGSVVEEDEGFAA
jgi:hypothetical protein